MYLAPEEGADERDCDSVWVDCICGRIRVDCRASDNSYHREDTVKDTQKDKQMSLREAGQFDMKFHIGGSDLTRMITTGWTHICQDRQKRGISRKARINAKKAAK